MVRVYLFTDIPGSGKDWTLAVFATSKHDAVNYVKRADGGGRFVGEVQPGKVDACCGAGLTKAFISGKIKEKRR